MKTNPRPAQKPTTSISKPQSKPTSQAQSKKVEVQKVIIKSEGGDIKGAFELFDANDGKIHAREIRTTMQNIGFDEKNPSVYEVMTEIDNPKNKSLGNFNDFCQTVNNRIPERETTEDLRRVFNLFLDDPNATTTSLQPIKKVTEELGENIDELELGAMLNKASKAGDKLIFEDLCISILH